MDSETPLDIDMRDFLRILRRRKLVVLYTVVAVVVFALGLSFQQTPVYSAKATVLVPSDVRQAVDQNRQEFSSPDLLNRALTNEVAFAQGDRVRSAIRKRLGRVPDIVISPVAETDTLAFVSESTSARRAALQANDYARTYLQERRVAKTTDYLSTAQTLVLEINSLRTRRTNLKSGDPQISGIEASIASLLQSLGDLRASGELSKVGGSVLRGAVVPKSPVSPNIALNGVLAALLGLVIGVLLAFIRDRFDDSLTSKEELEAASGGRTVMALIPSFTVGPKAHVVSISKPSSPAAEAYRILRSSIEIRNQLEDGGLRTIAVTSPRAGDGKTSTIANLGVALARTGQSVVIVDYDLRRPRIETYFNVDATVGIISVLLDESKLLDAMQKVEGQHGLSLVPAGALPPNPSEILSLRRATELIKELRAHADFILIDCPPVLPVPDSLAISQMVDGVILVAAAGRTSKRSIARAVELLEQVNAPLVGSVLNETPAVGEDNYGYGQYYAEVNTEKRAGARLGRWRARRKPEMPPPRVQAPAGSVEPGLTPRSGTGRPS